PPRPSSPNSWPAPSITTRAPPPSTGPRPSPGSRPPSPSTPAPPTPDAPPTATRPPRRPPPPPPPAAPPAAPRPAPPPPPRPPAPPAQRPTKLRAPRRRVVDREQDDHVVRPPVGQEVPPAGPPQIEYLAPGRPPPLRQRPVLAGHPRPGHPEPLPVVVTAREP